MIRRRLALGCLVALAACSSGGSANVAPTHSPIASVRAAPFSPGDIAVAADGTIYVSDCENGYVFGVADDGSVSIVAGIGVSNLTGKLSGDGGPATSAAIDCPAGLAVELSGAVLFADHANNRIREIATDGTITTIAGNGPLGTQAEGGRFVGDGGPAVDAHLQEPVGIAFDPAGDLLVADRDLHAVRSISPDGTITTIAGTGEESSTGDRGRATDATFESPVYVVPDGDGGMFVSDDQAMVIRRIDASGRIETFAGTGSAGSSRDGGLATEAEFNSPEGLAFNVQDGRLYVADLGNHVIRAIDRDGTVETVAGTGEPGCPSDGPALEQPLSDPSGLALDPRGDLLIADGTCGVLSLTPDGSLSVIARGVL